VSALNRGVTASTAGAPAPSPPPVLAEPGEGEESAVVEPAAQPLQVDADSTDEPAASSVPPDTADPVEAGEESTVVEPPTHEPGGSD
jgi:hypothetical protein